MAEEARQPDLGRVLVVAAALVLVVLGAAFGTRYLPVEVQRLIIDGPVLIAVLVLGTAWVLWRISRGRPQA